MDKDPELKKQYDLEKQNYQPPQMKIQKIEPKERTEQEMLLQYQKDIGKIPSEKLIELQNRPIYDMESNNQKIVQDYRPNIIDREQAKKDIFKPSILGPTMTLDEHENLEMALMKDKQNQ